MQRGGTAWEAVRHEGKCLARREHDRSEGAGPAWQSALPVSICLQALERIAQKEKGRGLARAVAQVLNRASLSGWPLLAACLTQGNRV